MFFSRLCIAIRISVTTLFIASACAFAQPVTTIYDFGSQNADGEDPMAGVVFDNNGNLFGTASLGAINGAGTIFALTPLDAAGDSWTERTLYRFHGRPHGDTPECRVIVTSSGSLFGTTWMGGANNLGTVFATFPPNAPGAAWTQRILYNFGNFSDDGVNPNAGLLAAPGKFYGVTSGGGAAGRGTIFQLTPPDNPADVWNETILYSFTAGGDAAFPSSELVMDKNGKLYGTTLQGGVNNLGAVYQLSPPAVAGQGWTETVIYSFNGPDGTLPGGALLIDAGGAIFGTTDGGGDGQEGTVFKLDPPARAGDAWTETVLYSFSGGRDGGNPFAGVTMDNRGRLFGAAQTGGSGGPDFGGVLFRLDPPTVAGGAWTETVLHSFGGPNGFRPTSPLVFRNGKFYGTTAQGGRFGVGTVFVLNP
jgi:uncharacterized repeat protein (TIGR03803 family)